jgi:hypothetical protein
MLAEKPKDQDGGQVVWRANDFPVSCCVSHQLTALVFPVCSSCSACLVHSTFVRFPDHIVYTASCTTLWPCPPHNTRLPSLLAQYYLEDGIEHHVLWCEAGPIATEAFAEIVKRERDPAVYDTIIFENPPALRSVPELHHVHILSKKRA